MISGIAENEAINPNSIYEQNEKDINTIYFDYLLYGWDSLSTAQQLFAETLAKSCLYTQGIGVYKARSLWSNAEPGFDYDDLYICTEGNNKNDVLGSIKEYINDNDMQNSPSKLIQNEVIVFPNPARNQLKVKHTYFNAKELCFELYDYTGRKVKVVNCRSCSIETTVSIDGFANGLYTYKVLIDHELKLSGKINIIQ